MNSPDPNQLNRRDERDAVKLARSMASSTLRNELGVVDGGTEMTPTQMRLLAGVLIVAARRADPR